MDTQPDDESLIAQLEQRVGRSLCGRYTLDKLLGVGGMAAVYRGTHRNGNRVAVKVMHTELCASKEMRTRFLREGYVANKVDHPGAVRVLDDDTDGDGTVFLVMEFLEGRTFESVVLDHNGTIAPRELVPLVCQLLDVLAAAHEKGIVHRDIKPENLFVVGGTTLKVLDFGIARIESKGLQATRTGRLLGTPVYMAPEQARGEVRRVDAQSDLWAVGAVMFRALTGRYVHMAETPEMALVAAATQAAPRLREVLPNVEPQIAEIVDRALATNKEERWRTATAMATALRGLRPEELSADPAPNSATVLEVTDTTEPAPTAPEKPVVSKVARSVVMAGTSANLANFSFDDETAMLDPPVRAHPVPQMRAAPLAPSTTAGMVSNQPARGETSRLLVPVLLGVGVLGLVGTAGALILTRSTTSVSPAVTATAPPEIASVAATEPSASGEPSPTQPDIASAAVSNRPPAPPATTITKRAPLPPSAAPPSAAPASSVCAPKKFLLPDGTPQWKVECVTK